jgi:hypothetical protein
MPASKRAAKAQGSLFGAVPLLFLCHFLLELVLGAVKLRGTYSGVVLPEGTDRFVRHHGVSLLAIALLGGLVWWRRLGETQTGSLASVVLAAFHAGCVAVMLHAYALGSGDAAAAKGAIKVMAMHAPFALAFAAHSLRAPAHED